jgi:hypothetical protein
VRDVGETGVATVGIFTDHHRAHGAKKEPQARTPAA